MITYKPDRCLVPVKIWGKKLEDFEEGARTQIENAASLPFAFHHVCMMPDGHVGYGAPIGGVLATKGVVIVNFVGVDIGCGMCALETPWKVEEISTDQLKKIMQNIRDTVPVGFNHHKEAQIIPVLPTDLMSDQGKILFPVIKKELQSAEHQLGTLGGGNHFIEIQKDENNTIWIMIHSGSRNLGKKVADYHNAVAKAATGKWFHHVPKEWDLAFLPLDSEEGKTYIREMEFCVEFALMNRCQMMGMIANAFNTTINHKKVVPVNMINIAHNYAAMENHFGQDVMVHRKGATRARTDEIGIIPGSQGTASYIVKGLGNPESFMSCSHGSGRKMSRTQAEKTLDLAAQQKILDDQGIIHGIRHQKDLDEAPDAYKDIEEVINNEKDLVEVVHKLRPLAVIKG